MLGSESIVFYPHLVGCEALPLWNSVRDGSCTLYFGLPRRVLRGYVPYAVLPGGVRSRVYLL